MPNTKNQTFRIRLIDELLSGNRWVTTKKMQKTIQLHLNEDVSIRTIQNDLRDLRDSDLLNYFAPLEYNRKKGAHRYTEEGFTIKNFSLQPEEIKALQFYAECLQVFSGYRLFDSFSSGIQKVINGVKVRNKISPATNPKTIIQTDTLVTPGGHEYLEDLVHAIETKLGCKIVYQKYGSSLLQKRNLQPLFLKEYRNRWYLLAFRPDLKELRTYALDRIKSLEVSDYPIPQPFEFNPEIYFKHSFGITTPNAQIEKVTLQFSRFEAPYIISLPIHPTQKVIKRTKKTLIISIEVIPCYELYDFILSKSPEVKVLAPASLANLVADKLNRASTLYKKK